MYWFGLMPVVKIANMSYAANRNEHTVWNKVSQSGFKQRVFVMYHATKPESASQIIRGGGKFKVSGSHCMLGTGVYASHTYDKAHNHGEKVLHHPFIVFKLLVYVGKVYRVKHQDDNLQKTWQTYYTSAWVKPYVSRTLAPSGLQENCIKSPEHLHILGVCYGWENLHLFDKQLTTKLHTPKLGLSHKECMSHDEQEAEFDPVTQKHLNPFLARIGVVPFRIRYDEPGCIDDSRCHYLADIGHDRVGFERGRGPENRLWVRSGDQCLENVETGRFLTLHTLNQPPKMATKMEKGLDLWQRLQKWAFGTDGSLSCLTLQNRAFLRVDPAAEGPQVKMVSVGKNSWQWDQPATKFTTEARYYDPYG